MLVVLSGLCSPCQSMFCLLSPATPRHTATAPPHSACDETENRSKIQERFEDQSSSPGPRRFDLVLLLSWFYLKPAASLRVAVANISLSGLHTMASNLPCMFTLSHETLVPDG